MVERGSLPPEVERFWLEAAIRGPGSKQTGRHLTVIADSPVAARRARELGATDPKVANLSKLPEMLPGTREDAKAALDVPRQQRWLAHVGPLDSGDDLHAVAGEPDQRQPDLGV